MAFNHYNIDTVDDSHHLDALLDDYSYPFAIIKFDYFDPNNCDGCDDHNNHKHNHTL